MTFTDLLVRDLAILHAAGGTNRYGDEQRDWAHASRTQVKGWIGQVTRTEMVAGREAEVQTWKLTLPPGTAVTGRDRINVDGETFEVVGPPSPIWTPQGEHHIEATIRRAEG